MGGKLQKCENNSEKNGRAERKMAGRSALPFQPSYNTVLIKNLFTPTQTTHILLILTQTLIPLRETCYQSLVSLEHYT